MLTTAMTTQISTIRTTWAVLIEVVVDMTDAWNVPRLTVALGAVPVLDKECNVTAVAPIPSPTEPRPMATLAHAARLGWMPRCASRASTCLSISEPHDLHPAPGVHHEQGALAGAGAVHPVQPARHAEPGLVEPGNRAGGDVLPHPLHEAIQAPGGPGGWP